MTTKPIANDSPDSLLGVVSTYVLTAKRTAGLVDHAESLVHEIATEISASQGLLRQSRALLRQSAPAVVAPPPVARKAEDANRPNRSSVVDNLIIAAERAAAMVTDPFQTLNNMIKLRMADDTDPYMLIGSLLEGMVQTLAECIPPGQRQTVAAATEAMMRQRLNQVLDPRPDSRNSRRSNG